MNRRRFHACLSTLAAAVCSGSLTAAEKDDTEDGPVNVITPTLGGMQFWADELFFHEWHIQRNVFTGHYRLLDGNCLRHAWGTFEQCQHKLDEIRKTRGLEPMSGKAVVVLHGLTRASSSMSKLSRYLRAQGGYTVFNVNYPSTRGTIGDHAASLAKIINRLDGIEEINFVAHSLGNLVVRHYLADAMRTGGEQSEKNDPRWKRMVMIGAPNNGAIMAETLLNNVAGRTIIGASGDQLAREWSDLSSRLATPPFEFGIIAGGRNADRGYNPLLEGDNDMVVTVASARLRGAADFVVLPVTHTFMMDDATVEEYTLRFFEHGHFVSAEARRPIAKPQA